MLRILHGIIYWDNVTGHVSVWYLPKTFANDKTKYKDYYNMLETEIYKEFGAWPTCSIIYEGPMKMQEIADAIYEEYKEENGWRVKE